MLRTSLLAGCAVMCASALLAQPDRDKYRSPYSVKFTHSVEELTKDLHGPRGDWREEAAIPHVEWYSKKVLSEYRAWGPPARHYTPPTGVNERPLEWRRERAVAVALRFQGYSYQHHHIPDWEPPANWPWEKVASGHNGKGVDCSNFSSFVYNLGFGLKPDTGIREQSERTEIAGPGAGRSRVETIRLPESYDEIVKTLHAGDLVYIKNKKGEISHVVIWVGGIGHSPDGKPLLIDSHGQDVRDSNGNLIPDGVHLRPFAKNSWYANSASHAHRILR